MQQDSQTIQGICFYEMYACQAWCSTDWGLSCDKFSQSFKPGWVELTHCSYQGSFREIISCQRWLQLVPYFIYIVELYSTPVLNASFNGLKSTMTAITTIKLAKSQSWKINCLHEKTAGHIRCLKMASATQTVTCFWHVALQAWYSRLKLSAMTHND